MASWLTRLSMAFVVAGSVSGAFVLSKDAKFRPGLERFKAETAAMWQSLVAEKAPAVEQAVRQAQLPFVVIEPRDLAAPMVGMPQVGVQPPEPAMTAMRVGSEGQVEALGAPAQSAPGLDLEPVEARLRSKVSAELFPYFDLYLYVSKATPDKGPWGQRMFVLAKQPDQSFKLLHLWLVSTGKEEPLIAPSGRRLGTHTPEGVFKLDRGRFYEDYTSRQWQSPMPNAMFFDWQTEGRPSGLAIHGSDAEGAKALGNRASHGCIRLSAENAKTLFDLVRNNYKGRVPLFAIDQNSGTMSTKGKLVRDENGKIVTRRGYKVLVFIEDFGGPSQDTVAALY